MRDQVKFMFNMGADFLPDTFKADVIALACELCGGCYVPDGTGYWIDGPTHADRFGGKAKSEQTLVIELTTEVYKADEVYYAMQYGIARRAEAHNIPIDWVHVSELPMKGRHFSVKATLSPLNAIVDEHNALIAAE
jgi:hypothetical protein